MEAVGTETQNSPEIWREVGAQVKSADVHISILVKTFAQWGRGDIQTSWAFSDATSRQGAWHPWNVFSQFAEYDADLSTDERRAVAVARLSDTNEGFG